MSFGKGSFQVANYVHQYERPSNFAILLCLNIVIWLGFYSSTTFSTFFRPKSTADTFVQYKTNNASLNSQDTSPERPFDSLWWPNRHNSVESEMIYNNQFPETCDDKKFLVFRLDKMGSRNIGSIVSQIAHWFEEVMVSKRVFIFAHDWEQANECESKTWDCFFMPISSCSVSDIRNLSACVEPNRNKTRQDPWNAEKNEQCVFVSRAYWRHGGKLIKNILKLENFGWRELRFRAYTYAFFFRHNDRLRKRVESNIQDLLRRNQIDSSKTVSMPIRGSDKCLDHDIKGSASGEVRCTPVSKFVLRLREYQKFYFPNDADIIDTVIVTSEDSNMVEKAVEHGEKMGYRMIVNDFDVMQGTGSANDLTGHKNTTNFDVMVTGSPSCATSVTLNLRLSIG